MAAGAHKDCPEKNEKDQGHQQVTYREWMLVQRQGRKSAARPKPMRANTPVHTRQREVSVPGQLKLPPGVGQLKNPRIEASGEGSRFEVLPVEEDVQMETEERGPPVIQDPESKRDKRKIHSDNERVE